MATMYSLSLSYSQHAPMDFLFSTADGTNQVAVPQYFARSASDLRRTAASARTLVVEASTSVRRKRERRNTMERIMMIMKIEMNVNYMQCVWWRSMWVCVRGQPPIEKMKGIERQREREDEKQTQGIDKRNSQSLDRLWQLENFEERETKAQ